MRQRKSLELYPLTMCYFIIRTQKCTKLFFNHYLQQWQNRNRQSNKIKKSLSFMVEKGMFYVLFSTFLHFNRNLMPFLEQPI